MFKKIFIRSQTRHMKPGGFSEVREDENTHYEFYVPAIRPGAWHVVWTIGVDNDDVEHVLSTVIMKR